MYLSAKSLAYIVATIINEAGKLSKMPYHEQILSKEINIDHTRDGQFYNVLVTMRRFCSYQENRIMVIVTRNGYPIDFIELINQDEVYYVISLITNRRKSYQYSSLSINDIKETNMVNELANDYLANILNG